MPLPFNYLYYNEQELKKTSFMIAKFHYPRNDPHVCQTPPVLLQNSLAAEEGEAKPC